VARHSGTRHHPRRWEIDGYVFNLGLAASWFRGEEITALPKAERDSFPWPGPLSAAIQDIAEPVRQNDLQRVRAEVQPHRGRRASPASSASASAHGR